MLSHMKNSKAKSAVDEATQISQANTTLEALLKDNQFKQLRTARKNSSASEKIRGQCESVRTRRFSQNQRGKSTRSA